MTTSISSAPAATEARISPIRCSNAESPAGKPVETAATGMPDGQPLRAHRLEQVGADRAPGLGAEPSHPAGRVVAGEGGEVHQGDGAQEPRGLPLALDRTAGLERRRPTLDRAPVHPDLLDPFELERHPRVARGDRHLQG
jgi:hypothetical protein